MIKILHESAFNAHESHHHNSAPENRDLMAALSTIQTDIITQQDEALIRYTHQFDNVLLTPDTLFVTQDAIRDAYTKVAPSVIDALKRAKHNIETFHRLQLPENKSASPSAGIEYAIHYTPIERAGLYVPGGRAVYPSTVLMNAIPAQLAGVQDIIITTPPQPDGSIPPQILVAADICGVQKILKAGGAQAVFALAYATQSVPKVDKIVGPGNIYVTQAKQMVYGQVDIDKPAGPSEVCVYIEDPRYAPFAASELLAQLEHDPLAIGIAISTSKTCLSTIQDALADQFQRLTRQSIIEKSIKNSALILAESRESAMTLINTIASEHLVLLTDDPKTLMPNIRHAGSIFMGPYSPVALGDYYAGPNHVLPTSGTARFASPLGVMDFMKFSSTLSYTKEALQNADADIRLLTQIEGFDAHYNTVRQRLDN